MQIGIILSTQVKGYSIKEATCSFAYSITLGVNLIHKVFTMHLTLVQEDKVSFAKYSPQKNSTIACPAPKGDLSGNEQHSFLRASYESRQWYSGHKEAD